MNPLTLDEVQAWPPLGPFSLEKERVLALFERIAELETKSYFQQVHIDKLRDESRQVQELRRAGQLLGHHLHRLPRNWSGPNKEGVMAKLTLTKFGAAWCPPCRDMARRQTLEKFAEKHPEVKVVVHDGNEDGGPPRWEAICDEWKIKNLPTIVWTYNGEELFRSSDVGIRAIEEQYARAKKKMS